MQGHNDFYSWIKKNLGKSKKKKYLIKDKFLNFKI